MSTGMFDGGYYYSVSALERLQRKFGAFATPRAKAPDPMVGHNMNSTRGCPCDACITKPVCRMTCSRFEQWVKDGDYPIRRGAKS